MAYPTDRDGKSKTASAVDREHYPEQNEVDNPGFEAGERPTHEQIAALAFELWERRGGHEASAEHYWLEAESQLRSERGNAHENLEKTGSVQR